MPYKFSKRSLSKLEGVHPILVNAAQEAIGRTRTDFGIVSGVRTEEEQNALYKAERSSKDGFVKLSKHQIQEDGYGHAIDIAAWKRGKIAWGQMHYYDILDVFQGIALERGIRMRFGGWWGFASEESSESLVRKYKARKRKAGKRHFVDIYHVEIYPDPGNEGRNKPSPQRNN